MLRPPIIALLSWYARRRRPTLSNLEYPQTWDLMPKGQCCQREGRRCRFFADISECRAGRLCVPRFWWLRPVLQWLCGVVIGHELSETEHGYGGGRWADCWCRWCDTLIKVPAEESLFAQEFGPLIGQEMPGDDACPVV